MQQAWHRSLKAAPCHSFDQHVIVFWYRWTKVRWHIGHSLQLAPLYLFNSYCIATAPFVSFECKVKKKYCPNPSFEWQEGSGTAMIACYPLLISQYRSYQLSGGQDLYIGQLSFFRNKTIFHRFVNYEYPIYKLTGIIKSGGTPIRYLMHLKLILAWFTS